MLAAQSIHLEGSLCANRVLQRGTVISHMHLTDDADEIRGRTDGVKGLVLRTEFLKKALSTICSRRTNRVHVFTLRQS